MGNLRVLLHILRSNFRSKIEFANLWNSETLFDVGGENEYSTGQQTAIFDYFPKLRICNCIILSVVHDIMHKEFSRST